MFIIKDKFLLKSLIVLFSLSIIVIIYGAFIIIGLKKEIGKNCYQDVAYMTSSLSNIERMFRDSDTLKDTEVNYIKNEIKYYSLITSNIPQSSKLITCYQQFDIDFERYLKTLDGDDKDRFLNEVSYLRNFFKMTMDKYSDTPLQYYKKFRSTNYNTDKEINDTVLKMIGTKK